ncbi:MAG: hypothetical protein JXB88_20455 [Spirochaetales bacterium]|nr:hypothetical protein [Spirochaetales bacterium]
MAGDKNWEILYNKAQEKIKKGSFRESAELFKQAGEQTTVSEEKIDAFTRVLLLSIRPGEGLSFSSAAQTCSRLAHSHSATSEHYARVYTKMEEYFTTLAEYVLKKEDEKTFEPLLLKIKDCFFMVNNLVAVAYIFNRLGEIANKNKDRNESWQKKRITYFRESAYFFEKTANWDDAANTYKSAGYAAREQKKYGIMEDCFFKAIECFLKARNLKEAAGCYNELSYVEEFNDSSRQLRYAMLSIEYYIAASFFRYLTTIIKRAATMIVEEPDPLKRKENLVILTGLAIQGKQYDLGIELTMRICSDSSFSLSKDEKEKMLAQIPELIGKQKEKYEKKAELFIQHGEYLRAAKVYLKLSKLIEKPGEKWKYQLKAALNYGAYRAPIYAERSDEIYDQMGDIQEHYDFIKNSFLLALQYAGSLSQKKETVQAAARVCRELARFYGENTLHMYCMGESLGQEYRKLFTRLEKKLIKE